MWGLQPRFWALRSGVRLGNKQEARSRLRGTPERYRTQEGATQRCSLQARLPKMSPISPSWCITGFKHKHISEKK